MPGRTNIKQEKLPQVRSSAIAGIGKRGGAARDAGRKIEQGARRSESGLSAAQKALGIGRKKRK